MGSCSFVYWVIIIFLHKSYEKIITFRVRMGFLTLICFYSSKIISFTACFNVITYYLIFYLAVWVGNKGLIQDTIYIEVIWALLLDMHLSKACVQHEGVAL